MSVTGRGCALELVADAPAADVRSRRACGQRHSAWAVSLAILSCSVSVATADFTATRPLAGTPGNGATRGITVPRVTPVGSLNGNGVGAWVGGEAMTSTTIMTHSPEFLSWALKHDKLVEYCSGSKPPCEESLHRESIWRTNAAAIEAHNNQGGSLMKKGLTRFADLTEIEFTAAHATYAGGVPAVAPPRKQETYGAATVTTPRRVGAAESSSETEALISLKLATDEAARRGEALPSDDEENELWEQDAPSDAVLHQAMVNSPFPALGASAGLTAEERRNQARERRREQRAAERAAREEQIGFGQGEENEQKSGPLGSGLPNHFDWSDQLDFGGIVHQGACAGCWAYSTAAVVEAARFVDNGSRERMSPYSLIDCDALDHGCATGNMASAYAWIQTSEFGLPPLERYPSLSVNGQCSTAGLGASLGAERFTPDGVEKGATGDETDDDKSSEPLKTSALGSVMPNLFGGDSANQKDKRGNKLNKDGTPIHIPSGNARTKGYCDLPVLHKDAERQLLRALAQQPVAVGVNIHALQFYESGIVQLGDCPPAESDPLKAINHAAVLTGWGFDDNTSQYYWILRNTYGDRWGESGYARLAFGRDEATGFGACALYTEGNYPLVGSLTCTPGSTRKEAVRHGSHVWLYPGGYNMGPHAKTNEGFGLFGLMNANGLTNISEKMQRFNLGVSESNRTEVVGVAAFLVLAAAVTIALQASTLAKLRREARRGTSEERVGLASGAKYNDDVLA